MSKEQLASLLNQTLPFAERMLQLYRGFHPYGAVLDREQIVDLVGTDLEGDIPPADELLESVLQALRQRVQTGNCLATALAMDVQVEPPDGEAEVNAILVSLEHADGSLVDVFVPYTLGDAGAVEYGQLFASGGEGRVFNPGGGKES